MRKSPENTLAAIRKILDVPETRELGIGLVKGLAMSLEFDESYTPPKPPTINQILTACKPAALGYIGKLGIVLTPQEGYDWVSTIPGAMDIQRDTFRQYFREKNKFYGTFYKEAYRVNGRVRILCSYAQCLHLSEINGNPLQNFLDKLKREFGIK